MELIFRLRLDRPDKKGRANVFGDLHWLGGNRWKVPTGVKVDPKHWQPEKSRRIHTSADDSNQQNLRLDRLKTAIGNVFLKADADKRAEASVTLQEIKLVVAGEGAGSKRMRVPLTPETDPHAPLPDTSTWQQLHDRWQNENQAQLAASTLRMLQQCVYQLEAFDSGLRVATLTRERLAQYTAYLYGQGLKDTTVGRHYWFLRECFQLTGKPAPRWLGRFTVRTGRPVVLQRADIRALAALDLTGPLSEERDMFLLQTQLLLRDSDLRALRPHHVRLIDLPSTGPKLCADIFQSKTREPVLVPLPALAATIWEKYEGVLPVRSNAHRTVLIKQLGKMAGLSREYVDVSFSGKVRNEKVRLLWEAMSTHTARHTGAALLVWATDGDQTLKEVALGHVSDSAYGYDTIERYGPKLLHAWHTIFNLPGAKTRNAPGFEFKKRGAGPSGEEE